ncbi:MAG: hypothetical protein NTW28_35815, partial [Candidatus Solibacter sp.]|nr:hypothetical protein [Candidatus Solibacter sp.]
LSSSIMVIDSIAVLPLLPLSNSPTARPLPPFFRRSSAIRPYSPSSAMLPITFALLEVVFALRQAIRHMRQAQHRPPPTGQ